MSNISSILKSIQTIMWQDTGLNGDAQRIEQLGWILFLKIFSACFTALHIDIIKIKGSGNFTKIRFNFQNIIVNSFFFSRPTNLKKPEIR